MSSLKADALTANSNWSITTPRWPVNNSMLFISALFRERNKL